MFLSGRFGQADKHVLNSLAGDEAGNRSRKRLLSFLLAAGKGTWAKYTDGAGRNNLTKGGFLSRARRAKAGVGEAALGNWSSRVAALYKGRMIANVGEVVLGKSTPGRHAYLG